MVKALQARGHTVAMTGDGVNDVLALKLADIGVAMGSGAAATKAVAELVLLDNRFATLPGVVAEGRRVTANIERVANLFVTKTVWATLLAVAAGAALIPYPFLPRHLTDHRHPGHRRPRVLPRARAEPPALPAWFRRPGAAVRRPGRAHRRRRDVRGVRPRAGARPSPDRAAHGRDPGHAHPQPVRARPAGDAADLAQDRAARRRARRHSCCCSPCPPCAPSTHSSCRTARSAARCSSPLLGAAALAGFWVLSPRQGPGPAQVAGNDLDRLPS